MMTTHPVIAASQPLCEVNILCHGHILGSHIVATDNKDESDYGDPGDEVVDSEDGTSDDDDEDSEDDEDEDDDDDDEDEDEEEEEEEEEEENGNDTEEDSDIDDIVDNEAEGTDNGEDQSLDDGTIEESDRNHALDDRISEYHSQIDEVRSDKGSNGVQQQVQIHLVNYTPHGTSIMGAAKRQLLDIDRNQKRRVDVERAQVHQKPAQIPQELVRSKQQIDEREMLVRHQFDEQQRMHLMQQHRDQVRRSPDLRRTQANEEEEGLEEEESADEDYTESERPFHARRDDLTPPMHIQGRNQAFGWQRQQQMSVASAHTALEESLIDEEEDVEDLVREDERHQVQQLQVQAQRQTMPRRHQEHMETSIHERKLGRKQTQQWTGEEVVLAAEQEAAETTANVNAQRDAEYRNRQQAFQMQQRMQKKADDELALQERRELQAQQKLQDAADKADWKRDADEARQLAMQEKRAEKAEEKAANDERKAEEKAAKDDRRAEEKTQRHERKAADREEQYNRRREDMEAQRERKAQEAEQRREEREIDNEAKKGKRANELEIKTTQAGERRDRQAEEAAQRQQQQEIEREARKTDMELRSADQIERAREKADRKALEATQRLEERTMTQEARKTEQETYMQMRLTERQNKIDLKAAEAAHRLEERAMQQEDKVQQRQLELDAKKARRELEAEDKKLKKEADEEDRALKREADREKKVPKKEDRQRVKEEEARNMEVSNTVERPQKDSNQQSRAVDEGIHNSPVLQNHDTAHRDQNRQGYGDQGRVQEDQWDGGRRQHPGGHLGVQHTGAVFPDHRNESNPGPWQQEHWHEQNGMHVNLGPEKHAKVKREAQEANLVAKKKGTGQLKGEMKKPKTKQNPNSFNVPGKGNKNGEDGVRITAQQYSGTYQSLVLEKGNNRGAAKQTMKATKIDVNIQQQEVVKVGKDGADSKKKGRVQQLTDTKAEIERKRAGRKAAKQDKRTARKDPNAQKPATEPGTKDDRAVTTRTDANDQLEGKQDAKYGAKPNPDKFVEQDGKIKDSKGSSNEVVLGNPNSEARCLGNTPLPQLNTVSFNNVGQASYHQHIHLLNILGKPSAEGKTETDQKNAEQKEGITGDFESVGEESGIVDPKATKEETDEHKKETNGGKEAKAEGAAPESRLGHKTETAGEKGTEKGTEKGIEKVDKKDFREINGPLNDKDTKCADKSKETSATKADKEAKKAEKTQHKLEVKVQVSKQKAIDKEAEKAEKIRQKLEVKVLVSEQKATNKEEKQKQKSNVKHDSAPSTEDADKEEERKQKLAAKEAIKEEKRRLKLMAKETAKEEKLKHKMAEKEEKSKLRAAAKEEKLKQKVAAREELKIQKLAAKEAAKEEKLKQKTTAKEEAAERKEHDKEEKVKQKTAAREEAAARQEHDKEERLKQKTIAKEEVAEKKEHDKEEKLKQKTAAREEAVERKEHDKEEKLKQKEVAHDQAAYQKEQDKAAKAEKKEQDRALKAQQKEKDQIAKALEKERQQAAKAEQKQRDQIAKAQQKEKDKADAQLRKQEEKMVATRRKEEEKIEKQREREAEKVMANQRKEAAKSAAKSATKSAAKSAPKPTAGSSSRAVAPRKAGPARRRR